VFTGEEGLVYYLTAFAYDDAFNYSTPAFCPTTAWDSIPSPKLPHFEAAPGTCEVRLAWTSPSSPEFQGTLIRFSNETYPEDPDDGEPVPNGNDGVFQGSPGSASSFIHSGLACDTTYYYTAWAFDQAPDYSLPSYAGIRSTDPPEAPPLSGFAASSTLEGILLEWTCPTDGGFGSTTIRYSNTGYPVHRLDGNPVPNGNDGVFEGMPGSDSSFIHSDVTQHEVYYYRAWAGYEGGEVSMPVSLSVVAPDVTPPDPPLSFAAGAIPDGIDLQWRNPLDPDALGVMIRFSHDTYPTDIADGNPVPNGSDGLFDATAGTYESFAHIGLPGCLMYYYTAWSYDELMRYSDPVNVSYISPIDTVQSFLALPGDRTVGLYWAAPANEACEYHDAVAIRYATDGFPETAEDGQPVPNGNDGRFVIIRKIDLYTFEHSGLEPGVTYYYSAFVVSDDPGRASLPVQTASTPTKIMPGVTEFSAVGEDKAVRLTWTVPAEDEPAEVRIRYATEIPPQTIEEGSPLENGNGGVFEAAPAASYDFIHTGLMNDTTYYYSIWVLDEAGYMSDPEHAQTTPLDTQPPDISISVFQNPYLSEHLDIYLLASEEVIPESVSVAVETDTVPMQPVTADGKLWRGDYTLSEPSDSIRLLACACDPAGNSECAAIDFAAGYLTAALGGEITSPDGNLRLEIPPETLARDAFILVLACAPDDDHNYDRLTRAWSPARPLTESGQTSPGAYSIGPTGLLRGLPARLEMSYGASDLVRDVYPDQVYIEQRDVGPLPSYVDAEKGVVEAEIHELGIFRLAAGRRGTSRMLDPGFLTVGTPRPNPFSREMNVRFEVRAPQRIRATVYDIAGREVSCLIDETTNPGVREITWNGEGPAGALPSGVYFLKVATDNRSVTRKALLLR
jgi:hypothetical protein